MCMLGHTDDGRGALFDLSKLNSPNSVPGALRASADTVQKKSQQDRRSCRYAAYGARE